MSIDELQRHVFNVAAASPICDIPHVRNLTSSSITLRIEVTSGGFVDVFFNEVTGTTAYALIRQGIRVFGVDNTGGWHMHPFEDPGRHDPMPGPMNFGEFIALVESQ